MTIHSEGIGDGCNKSKKPENVVGWGGEVQLQRRKLTLELLLKDKAGKEGQKGVFYRNEYGQELLHACYIC